MVDALSGILESARNVIFSWTSSKTPWSQVFDKVEGRIVILGPDFAGKTSLLYKCLSQKSDKSDIITSIPSLGVPIPASSLFVCLSDTIRMGDWATSRRYAHREFYPSCVGCIFMLDSHAEDWFPDVREHLIRLFDHGEFGLPAGVPVVVLANKQDLQNAHSAEELQSKLQLRELNGRPWHIVSTSISAEYQGVYDGLKWLSEKINEGLDHKSDQTRHI